MFFYFKFNKIFNLAAKLYSVGLTILKIGFLINENNFTSMREKHIKTLIISNNLKNKNKERKINKNLNKY